MSTSFILFADRIPRGRPRRSPFRARLDLSRLERQPLRAGADRSGRLLQASCCPVFPGTHHERSDAHRQSSVSVSALTVCLSLLQECVLGEHSQPVHDIAWAACLGRSFHLIATASREASFKASPRPLRLHLYLYL